MAKTMPKPDPLDVLPDVTVPAIAQATRVSTAGVEGAATRLGITLKRSATGRKAATPQDAVKIIEALRGQARG
jgi:predicted TIM-barrel enzyme